jgi:hypothetical protein
MNLRAPQREWDLVSVLHFRNCLLKAKHIWKKDMKLNLFLFSLQFLSETFLIPVRIKGNSIINVLRFSCKVSGIFDQF